MSENRPIYRATAKGKSAKVGLVITTHNRPELTAACFDSLVASDWPDSLLLVVVDDGSRHRESIRLLSRKFPFDSFVIRNPRPKGVSYSLAAGFGFLIEKGCDVFMCLDNDAVVSEDFFSGLLSLLDERPGKIVSGFNTLTRCHITGLPRHPVKEDFGTHVLKESLGGINICFGGDRMTDVLDALGSRHHWDWALSRAVKEFYVTTPSLVQHTGVKRGLHRRNPDIAEDFVDKPITIISQPFGIGDIIFCQTLAHRFERVLWPVEGRFLAGLRRAYPYPSINFVDSGQYSKELRVRVRGKRMSGKTIVPLRFSDTIMNVPYKDVMRAKYDMFGLDYHTWPDYAMPTRDRIAEDELKLLVGAVGEYHLINNFWGNGNRVSIPETNMKTVFMRPVEGYSLFDWMGVMEGAAKISTVSTSVLFLLFLLDLACVPDVYLRGNGEPHANYDYLFGRKFNYV